MLVNKCHLIVGKKNSSGTAIRLANEGYACYGIDYQGHGKSAGLSGYINNFDDLVDDCLNHFTSICGN